MIITTPRLRLVLESTESVLARIDAMPPEDRAQVSPAWLDQLRASTPGPWTHGFAITDAATGTVVGSCAFKGPPAPDGSVEIAYAIDPGHRGRGYATEAAQGLTRFALEAGHASVVRAHTLPEPNASTRVLTACGFRCLGTVEDPEDGPVWRWERAASTRDHSD